MIHSKDDNQYYGKYFENAVVSAINNTPFENLTGFIFSDEDKNEMNEDAKIVANTLKASHAEWVGNQTSKQDCDAIIDGVHTEIKYVSGGTGTYLNTSLEYFNRELGFTSLQTYMEDTMYPFLEKIFGESVRKNISPVSQEVSHDFRHNRIEEYNQLQVLDKATRKKYTADLYNFLLNNPQKLNKLLTDVLTKSTSGKSTPDRLIIFNYLTKQILIIDKETIKSYVKSKTFKNAGLSLVFDNLRIAIGWQNGNGLNNPTLRAFIK